jgi:hypothetical protein
VRWTLTLRTGPKVIRERHGSLHEALTALETHLRGLAPQTRRQPVKAFVREVAPVGQIAARAEIAGPGRVRGGADLRGDGSVEAFTGRLRRRVLEQRPGEDAYAALRRALGT